MNQSVSINNSPNHRRPSAPSSSVGFVCTVGIMLLMVALWYTADPTVEFIHKVYATITGLICLQPWVSWFQKRTHIVPYYEIICLYFFMVLCPAIFLGPIEYLGASQFNLIEGERLTGVLMVSMAAVVAYRLSYHFFVSLRPVKLPRIDIDPKVASNYILGFLGFAVFGPYIVSASIGGAWGKVSNLLLTVNGSASIYALTRYYYNGHLQYNQKILYFTGMGLFMISGLATGWLSMLAFPILAYLIADFQSNKKVPILKVLLVALVMILFNMSKKSFRDEHWGGRMGGSRITSIQDAISRTGEWVSMSFEQDTQIAEGTRETVMSRVSNFDYMAHIIDSTPEHNSHLGISIYENVPAMFIPRLLWKDKPTVVDTANDIALKYGYISERQVGTVALDVGLIPEAYIAYGTYGVISVMVMLGCIVGLLSSAMGSGFNGNGWSYIMTGLICGGGIMITWTASSFLAGFWQTIFILFLLYYPLGIISRKRRLQ